jgi:hypothetical protein
MSMPSYWIVGATVQTIDMSGHFIEGGFWFADQANSQNEIGRIQLGDRLIIKKGFASPEIEIKAVGTVKGIETFTSDLLGIKMLFVSWLDLRSENHTIPSRGMFGAVHGPFAKNDAPVNDVLALL